MEQLPSDHYSIKAFMRSRQYSKWNGTKNPGLVVRLARVVLHIGYGSRLIVLLKLFIDIDCYVMRLHFFRPAWHIALSNPISCMRYPYLGWSFWRVAM